MRKIYRTLARRLAFALGARHPALLDAKAVPAERQKPLPVQPLKDALSGDRIDFLFCHNVLERTHPADLPNALSRLAETSNRICFVISTRFSDALDANDDNLNKTILDPAAWQQALAKSFADVTRFRGIEHDSCLFLTWKPGRLEKLVIGHARRVESLSRRIRRWRNALGKTVSGKRENLGEQALFDLLRGKSVALIGNSRALAQLDHGAAIDAHDIVIRCNRAPIIKRVSHGARTDWIATSVDLDRELIALKGASNILWMSPNHDGMSAAMAGLPNLYIHPAARNAELATQTGARPSTGLMVIDLLQHSECTKIDLYGFDFFKSQSVSGDRTKASAPHDFDSEEMLVSRWVAEDPRLTIHT
jgi:hypothetical protein